jgi:hypothetical protein
MGERFVSEEERHRLEQSGDTGYGESFPMGDCDEVGRAVEAYGRAPVEHRAELRRNIIRRHQELSCAHPLPESWQA